LRWPSSQRANQKPSRPASLPDIERQPRKKLEPSPERLLAVLHRWRDVMPSIFTNFGFRFLASHPSRNYPESAISRLLTGRPASGRSIAMTDKPHQQREARQRIDAGETQRSVARSYNVSQSTISRLGV
jgi:hypothetical protein